jgi:hypothetical protein
MARHIFVAGGDACAICEGLAGLDVTPGFQPHDNCNCNTIESDEGDCTFDFEEGNTWQTGSRFRSELMITVTCPDGSSVSVPGITVDLEAARDGENDEMLEDAAEQACEENCPKGPDEFLCC